MRSNSSRWLRRWSMLVLSSVALLACASGDPAADEDGENTAAAAATSAEADCGVPIAEVSDIMKQPVRQSMQLGSPNSPFHACQFELTENPGYFLELTSQPAAAADSLYAEIQNRAKGMLGQDAQADRLDLGNGGLAYGSGSYSEAATVSGGRVYHASMEYMTDLGNTIGNRKDAMVELVRRMID